MWYDILAEDFIETDDVLYETLLEIAQNNGDCFEPTELIDDMYSPVNYFCVSFYPSRIIKELDDSLYQEIWSNLMTDWVEEVMAELIHYDPEEGDTIASLLEINYKGLEDIVWKEIESENE